MVNVVTSIYFLFNFLLMYMSFHALLLENDGLLYGTGVACRLTGCVHSTSKKHTEKKPRRSLRSSFIRYLTYFIILFLGVLCLLYVLYVISDMLSSQFVTLRELLNELYQNGTMNDTLFSNMLSITLGYVATYSISVSFILQGIEKQQLLYALNTVQGEVQESVVTEIQNSCSMHANFNSFMLCNDGVHLLYDITGTFKYCYQENYYIKVDLSIVRVVGYKTKVNRQTAMVSEQKNESIFSIMLTQQYLGNGISEYIMPENTQMWGAVVGATQSSVVIEAPIQYGNIYNNDKLKDGLLRLYFNRTAHTDIYADYECVDVAVIL